MKAVVLEVDERMLEKRRRLGLDRWDEMWEGVLHMVPPANGPHQSLSGELFVVLRLLTRSRGLVVRFETGLFRPGIDDDYRVPDLLVTSPERRTRRGVDGAAELVVEILSPGDESYAKLDWYAALGVQEIVLIEPDTKAVELFRGTAKGPVRLAPDANGVLWSDVLDASFATVGDAVRVTWDGGQADVTPD